MEEYNIGDVIQLEQIYDKDLPWIPNHPSPGLYSNNETLVCTNCGSDDVVFRGYAITKVLKYRRAQCKNCGKWLRSNKTVSEKGIEKLIGIS